MENFYRLKVTVGKITFEIESHDKKWVEAKEAKLMGDLFSEQQTATRLAQFDPSQDDASVPTQIGSTLTIQEFYKKYVSGRGWPRTTIALMVMYYLEKTQKVESISTSNIKGAFQEIGFPKYNTLNYADILNQLKRGGYLNKIDKAWKLTITGIDFVVSQLDQQ